MLTIFEDLAQFRLLGKLLQGSISSEIREANDSGWEPHLVAGIRDAAEKYIKIAARFARYLGVSALIPFVFAINSLVQNQPLNGFGIGYSAWLALVGLFAIWLFFPLFVIVPPLRRLPDGDYRELLRPLWTNLEFFYIIVTSGLFAYIYPSWNFSATLPLWGLLGALWLFAPWAIYLAKRDRIFIQIRLAQLGILIAVTFVIAASPVPMKNFQWWAERQVADKIRPVEQREITADWATLRWFSQEGAPNVWYSFSAARGYQLFASPGHNTDTNQDLTPVLDELTKDKIVAAFTEQNRARELKTAFEKEKQLTELEAQRQQAAKQEERRNTEHRTQLVRTYVFPTAVKNAANDRPLTLVVIDSRQQQDHALTERVSKLLSASGLRNQPAVFTPAFFASAAFQEVLEEKQSTERPFHPEDFATQVLVIQTTTTVSAQKPVNGVDMLAADMTWKVRLISLSDSRIQESDDIDARGVGFKEADARDSANERAASGLLKWLSTNRSKFESEK